MRIAHARGGRRGIRSGQQLYVHCAAATLSFLLDALVARAPELRDVRWSTFTAKGPGRTLPPRWRPHFRHRALFIGPNARAAVNEGRADYIPVFLSDVPHLLTSGLIPLDAVFINVSPPDEHGFCSLGTSVEAMQVAIRSAKTVIAQLNRSMPRTLGEFRPRRRHRPCDRGGPAALRAPPERDRGRRAADRRVRRGPCPDRATIQMGIGAIPTAVASALHGKRDLGVHTGD